MKITNHLPPETKFSLTLYSTDKVEFPELGMELIDAGRDMDNINDDDDVNRSFVVSVPNPAEVTKAQIGNKDFDLVSELSERFSVTSFDVSNISSSDDNDEEMSYDDKVASEYSENKQEADQEYTIYEQLPVCKSYQYSTKTML